MRRKRVFLGSVNDPRFLEVCFDAIKCGFPALRFYFFNVYQMLLIVKKQVLKVVIFQVELGSRIQVQTPLRNEAVVEVK